MFSLKLANPLFFILIAALFSGSCHATVFYSKEEAMKMAFGEDATVEILSLFPTAEQVAEIEQKAKVKLESNLIGLYVGKRQGAIIGYAAIESHNVRTQPETLLVVLTADGKLKNCHMLAFHEPPEYQPPERWFALLNNRPIEDLTLGQNIQGIAGATLSTRAAVDSVRKVLAVFQTMVKGKSN